LLIKTTRIILYKSFGCCYRLPKPKPEIEVMGPYPGPSPNEEETTGEVSPYMIKK